MKFVQGTSIINKLIKFPVQENNLFLLHIIFYLQEKYIVISTTMGLFKLCIKLPKHTS